MSREGAADPKFVSEITFHPQCAKCGYLLIGLVENGVRNAGSRLIHRRRIRAGPGRKLGDAGCTARADRGIGQWHHCVAIVILIVAVQIGNLKGERKCINTIPAARDF